jgi:lysophospholipase L1-like esterase
LGVKDREFILINHSSLKTSMAIKLLLIAAFVVIMLMMSFNYTKKKKKILFFGDSITELAIKPTGYISLLNEKIKAEGLEDKIELIGSGISGNKIYDLYLRIEQDVMIKDPHVVFIFIGVNDVWHKRLSGTGTDFDKFEKFYSAIIQKLTSAQIKVVLCTPAVIGEKTDFSNELDGDLNKYSALIRSIATKNNLPLVDLRKSFLAYNLEHNIENKEAGILTYDKVHLNDKGNELVAAEMWKEIKSIK